MTKPPHLDTKQDSYNFEHGTPDWILQIVRSEFGPIFLDLASSRKHNSRVGAKLFFSDRIPCPPVVELIDACFLGSNELFLTEEQTTFCNPPGPAYSVQWFFDVWLGRINQGANGAFLFFNMDQMRRCEPITYRELVVLAFRDRVKYIGNEGGASFPSALVLTGPLQGEYGDVANVFEWRT